MKKYLFGLSAIIFAVAAFAFTNPEFTSKKRTTYEFYYHAPSGTDFTDGAVKTLGNWTVTSITCTPSSNVKACNIRVDAAYVDEFASPVVLQTSGSSILSIATLPALGTVKYVTTTTGVSNIINKTN